MRRSNFLFGKFLFAGKSWNRRRNPLASTVCTGRLTVTYSRRNRAVALHIEVTQEHVDPSLQVKAKASEGNAKSAPAVAKVESLLVGNF